MFSSGSRLLQRSRKPMAMAGAAALTASLVLAPTVSSASGENHDAPSSTNPADWTPDILDLTNTRKHIDNPRVYQTATVGGTTIAVGDFTHVLPRGATTPIEREDVVAFDENGVKDTFDVDFGGTNPKAFDIVPADDGTSVYIAGKFTDWNGVSGTKNIVKVDVATGIAERESSEPGTDFRSRGYNSAIRDIKLVNGRLFVAGDFTKFGGQPRSLLVEIDPESGFDTNRITGLTFAGQQNGGKTRIVDFSTTPDGSSLVAIGNFRTVNGESRPQIAIIDTSGEQAVLDTWATQGFAKTCSRSFDTYMYDVDVSPDGSYFAVGTTGAYSGGPGANSLCDAISRWETGRHGAGQLPTWVEYTGGDTVTAVEAANDFMYVGGHFRWMNNPFCADRLCAGGIKRQGLAALDARNGLPLSWDPRRQRGWGVWGFRISDQGLWLGDDSDRIGGETRSRLALLPLDPSNSLPAEETGTLVGGGQVYLLGEDGSADVVAFDGTTASAPAPADVRNLGSATTAPRGAFMVDDKIYIGTQDGKLYRQLWKNWGVTTAKEMNLNNLSPFIAELPNMRSMFYDSTTARLYYTIEGDNTLHYRHFLPENDLVGSLHFTVPSGAVNWGDVRGAFLADGTLYVTMSTGDLHAIAWDGGPGEVSTAVSGPSLDGVDWRARAAFLLTR